MSNKSTKERIVIPPEFVDSKSPDYKYVFATGVFGGLSPNDAKMIFFLDRLEPTTTNEPRPGALKIKKVIRELQVEVHMTLQEFKNIAIWMNNNIKRYEDRFGEITVKLKGDTSPTGLVTWNWIIKQLKKWGFVGCIYYLIVIGSKSLDSKFFNKNGDVVTT